MQDDVIHIRPIQRDDIEKIVTAYSEPVGCNGAFENYIRSCFEQNLTRERITFIAFFNDEAAGFVNIIYKSDYPYFQERNIPEINDLRVLLKYRRRGIGKRLIQECEKFASEQYDYIGLGVGLYKHYGSAQRLYTKNGYVFDGNGLTYKGIEVKPGNNVFVDDDLLLYMYKKIR